MDALKPFIQRVAQPVLLSFCISWVLWNWEIVIALLWYDAKTISATKSATHMEYIKLHANGWKNYALPLACALLYLPIRYGVNWLNAFFRTIERNHVLQVRGAGKMSTLRFLELKKSYDDRIAQISDFIDNQAKLTTDLNNAETKASELQDINNALSEAYDKSKNVLELIKKDNENNQNKIDNYISLSKASSLIGNYEFGIWYIANDKSLSYNHNIAFSGDVEVKFDGSAYQFVFNSKYPEFTISIDHYFYNILSETFIIRFTDIVISSSSDNTLKELLSKLKNQYFVLSMKYNNFRFNLDDRYYLELEKIN